MLQQVQPIPFFRLPKIGNEFIVRQPRVAAQAPNRSGSLGAFTEWYYQSGGSNLNAGSTNSNTATYTSTNGNWSTTTNVFTPVDGSNPVASGVRVGDFASIFLDAATVSVYIARISNVINAVNGAITITTSVAIGTAPSTGATGRTIRVGGAYSSPSNATGFPLLSGNFSTMKNLSGDRVRLNFRNDQTYSFGGGNSWNAITSLNVQGFTDIPGDGGRALWSSSATGADGFILTGNHATWIDIIFQNTGASGSNSLVTLSGGHTFVRCVFRNSRGTALDTTNAGALVVDCEFYNWNSSNSTNKWAIGPSSTFTVLGCYFHDCTADTTPTLQGALLYTSAAGSVYNCIFQRIVGMAILYQSALSSSPALGVSNCDFYVIGGDAIRFDSASTVSEIVIRNCNFLRCGRAINISPTVTGTGILNSNSYGSGSMANSSPDILRSSIEVGKRMYAADTSPWAAPNTGNFTLVDVGAMSTGYASFTEVDGTNTGTRSYPDRGAAQHLDIGVFSSSENFFPDGFIGHDYTFEQIFTGESTVTLQSGSLPDGLVLTQALPTVWHITGIPTTLGTFSFVIRVTSGSTFLDSVCHIEVLPDPNEGVGGVGGG